MASAEILSTTYTMPEKAQKSQKKVQKFSIALSIASFLIQIGFLITLAYITFYLGQLAEVIQNGTLSISSVVTVRDGTRVLVSASWDEPIKVRVVNA
jgi:hypothetical protein